MTEHIEKTIQDALAKREKDLETVRETERLINQLCQFAGQQPMFEERDVDGATTLGKYQGDEFFNKKQHTACRMILEHRQAVGLGPATPEEFYDALVKGGYEFTASSESTALRGIKQMLAKNSSVFQRLPSGKWGLSKWYGTERRSAAKKDAAPDQDEPDTDAVEDGGAESEDPGADEPESAAEGSSTDPPTPE